MENYINDKKKLYSAILDFLENSNEDENDDIYFNEIINIMKAQEIKGDCKEIQQFLRIIKNIGENHHRDQYFNEKMNQILLHYKEQIKQSISNDELFHIFENNKKIVLFLLKNGIIKMTESIYREMMYKIEPNGIRYWHFFIPEIENFNNDKRIKFCKEELLTENPNFFENYEEKRQEGENDLYICSLIRQDSVEEFISLINRHNISYSSIISPSIFETNSFLIENKDTTLIEYSAFFGSIQIFQHLLLNNVELKPTLWLYAIHSKNAELIHLLELNRVSPSECISDEDIIDVEDTMEEEDNEIKTAQDFVMLLKSRLLHIMRRNLQDQKEENISSLNYDSCYIESIKCHHNDIAEYIECNLLDQKAKKSMKKMIISNCLKYLNYIYFQLDDIISYGFIYLCLYHHDKLVDLLLKMNEDKYKMKIIL